MPPDSTRSVSICPEELGKALRSLVATALALGICLCLVVGTSPSATAYDAKSAVTSRSQSKAALIQARAAQITNRPAVLKQLRRINRARINHGLRPLRLSKCLSRKVAQPWARHMARTGEFGHQNISIVHKSCPRFGWAGENIAAGYPTVGAVMTAWLHSSGHRTNLLRPQFTHVGLGIKRDSSGRRYWVQDFGG